MRDYDDEDTTEPFPEPCPDVTEDSVAYTAETVAEPSETATEQIAEQDMGILISVPEAVPESDNSAVDLCIITPEIRNSVIRELYGNWMSDEQLMECMAGERSQRRNCEFVVQNHKLCSA